MPPKSSLDHRLRAMMPADIVAAVDSGDEGRAVADLVTLAIGDPASFCALLGEILAEDLGQ